MVIVHLFVNESSQPFILDQIIWRTWKSTRTRTSGKSEFIQYHTEIILDRSEEILNVHTIESASLSWTRSTLAHDQVIQWTQAKVHVDSDSVLCLGEPDDRERTSYVVISRGKSRFVGEIRIPMPNSDQVQNYSLNFRNLKEENLA